jgi:hypothetical protein
MRNDGNAVTDTPNSIMEHLVIKNIFFVQLCLTNCNRDLSGISYIMPGGVSSKINTFDIFYRETYTPKRSVIIPK